MVRLLAVLVLAGASVQAQTITQTFGSGANSFSIEFVTIGNLGNTPDVNGLGAVGYSYSISTYEVSRDLVNKVNSSAGLNISMILDTGSPTANKPATGVSWNEAARFVNFLNTSKGFQPAYKIISSGVNDNVGVWQSGDVGFDPLNPFRNKNAFYFLPSADEWHKAAFYNPSSASYFRFATSSDSSPSPTTSGLLGAVYNHGLGPADVNLAGSLSPYGTMAQSGNAWEWEESAFDLTNDNGGENRGLRGGSWEYSGTFLYSRTSQSPTSDKSTQGFYDVGFRVASVPEPSSPSLLLAGGLITLTRRRKF